MEKLLLLLFAFSFLAGCSNAPDPKIPDESHRTSINKTFPDEALGGDL